MHSRRFSTVLHSSYQLFVNDNKTRLFLALPIEDTNGQIIQAVKCVDEALTLFRQPAYYADPKFHIRYIQTNIACLFSFKIFSIITVFFVFFLLFRSFASHIIPLEEGKFRESIINRINTQPTTVTVDADFMHAHQAELKTDLDAEESDDESDSWQCEAKEKIMASQTIDKKESPPEVKSTVLGGLLAGYDSDNSSVDSVSTSDMKQGATDVVPKSDLTIPALNKVVTFDAIECKIGNRLFRLDLSGMGQSKFYEVLPTAM